jgi:carbon monoxide dehydrogenase subunit G
VAVRIEKTLQVKAPVDRVWKLLSDPRSVVNCVPGAQLTEAVDELNFKGAVSVKIGPSVTDYKGEVRIERLDAVAHEIEITGKGLDVRGRGSASVKMTGKVKALPDGTTEVSTVADVNVVGILAQLGGRMMHDISDLMFREFTRRFQGQLEQAADTPVDPAPAAAAKPVNAIRLLIVAMGASIGRLLGRIFGPRMNANSRE